MIMIYLLEKYKFKYTISDNFIYIMDNVGYEWYIIQKGDKYILEHQNYKTSDTKMRTHRQGIFTDLTTLIKYIKKHTKKVLGKKK